MNIDWAKVSWAVILATVPAMAVMPSPAMAQAVMDNRPAIALLSSSQQYGNISESIYNQVSVSLSALNRFDLLEHSRLKDALRKGQLRLEGQGSGVEVASDLKLGLIFAYGVDSINSTQDNYYDKKSGKTTTTYKESWSGHLTIINVATGAVYKQFPLEANGSSIDGSGQARSAATGLFIADMMEKVRETFKLEAQIIARSGRTIRLNVGEESGVKSDMFFEVVRYGMPQKDPISGEILGVETESVGQVLVSKAFGKYAEAYVVKGNYGIKDKDQLREAPSLRNLKLNMTAAAELVPLSYTDFSNNTTSTMSLMPRLVATGSTLLPQVGVEAAAMVSAGVTGFGPSALGLSLDAGLQGSYELIPELLSIYGLAGLGGLSVSQQLATMGKTVTSFGLNAFGGTGLRLNMVGGLSLFGEARYRTGSTLSKWSYLDSSNDQEYAVPASMVGYPSFNWGGLSYQGGLSYAF